MELTINRASYKNPQSTGVRELLGWRTTSTSGQRHTQLHGDRTSYTCDLSPSSPGWSSASCIIPFNKLVDMCSLSSVGHSSQLTEAEQGSWALLNNSQWVRSTSDNVSFQLASVVCVLGEAVLQD